MGRDRPLLAYCQADTQLPSAPSPVSFPLSHTTYSAGHLGGVVRPKGGVMARPYETVYIFNSTLEESQINERLDRYHQLLGGADVVSHVSHWGKRTLAYPLGRQTTGYYVVAQFETGDFG